MGPVYKYDRNSVPEPESSICECITETVYLLAVVTYVFVNITTLGIPHLIIKSRQRCCRATSSVNCCC